MGKRRPVLRGQILALLLGGLFWTGGGDPPTAAAGFGEDEKQFRNDAYPVELRKEVTAAIDRAAHWLLQQQRGDGSWDHASNATYGLGATALATLSLLKAGVPADHPRVENAFRSMRNKPLDKTYSVAILLMALDAKYEAVGDGFTEEKIDRYGNRIETTPCEEKISKDDLEWMKEAVKFLLDHQGAGSPIVGNGGGSGAKGEPGAWRYPGGGWDLSNTQYALLGLKAAVRCGIKIPAEAWVDSLKFLLDAQEKTGDPVEWRANEVRGDYRIEWTEKARARGFAYTGDESRSPTGSMTTAGLAGLMICQSELWKSRRFTGDLREKTRTAIRDGLAWMQENYDVTTNPKGGAHWHYYYLYGLERAGILGRTRYMGARDWYLDGARYLLAMQEPGSGGKTGGSWNRGDLVDTCFALLFLKRASWRTSNPAITPGDTPLPPGR